jgi:hypothetical protein
MCHAPRKHMIILSIAVEIYVITSATDVKKILYLFHRQLNQRQLILPFSSFVCLGYQHTIVLYFLLDHNLNNRKHRDLIIELIKTYSNKNNNLDMDYKQLLVFDSFDFV